MYVSQHPSEGGVNGSILQVRKPRLRKPWWHVLSWQVAQSTLLNHVPGLHIYRMRLVMPALWACFGMKWGTMGGKGPALCPVHDGEHAVSGPSSFIQETSPGREEGGLGLWEPLFLAPSIWVGARSVLGVGSPLHSQRTKTLSPLMGRQASGPQKHSPMAGVSP